MSPKLYGFKPNPTVRSVLLTAAALELQLDFVEVNLLAQEQLTQDFLKINPQHTLPTLVDDDGTVIWDSHAINIYLTAKYGKDDSLYPEDVVQRAIINQRLYFDSGLAFPALKFISEPIIYFGFTTIPEQARTKVFEVYDFLEKFLGSNPWMAGKYVTLADLSLIPSLTTLNYVVPIEMEKFPKLHEWIKQAEALSYYDKDHVGLDECKKLYDARLKP